MPQSDKSVGMQPRGFDSACAEAGTISDAEYRDLESYVRVRQFVAVMQAKARLAPKNRRGKA